MANEIIQEVLEEGRKIEELDSVLVNEFDKAIKSENSVGIGQDVTINFEISHIPENLRELFRKRLSVLWGEISNHAPLKEKKYFYCRGMSIDGDNVTAKLVRNW